MVEDVPSFITQLLSDEFGRHDKQFWLLKYRKDGKFPIPERIGVLGHMLAAHSLVFRKMFEPDHLWYDYMYDVDMLPIPSHVWISFLTVIYGHNNVKSIPVPLALELLGLAQGLDVGALKTDALKKIKRDMAPEHVCLALRQPNCLKLPDFQFALQKLLFEKARTILHSTGLPLISPDSMKFLLFLQCSGEMNTDSYAEIWRIIWRWAKARILRFGGEIPAGMMPFLNPNMVEPSVPMQRMCCRNMIRLVENFEKEDSDRETILKMATHYHAIPREPPYKMYLCTRLDEYRHVIHELFSVTVVKDSRSFASPVDMKESSLWMNTGDSVVELYAVVCAGLIMKPRPVVSPSQHVMVHNGVFMYLYEEQFMYNMVCTVKLYVRKEDEWKAHSEYSFHKKATINEDFHICFRNLSGAKLFLEKDVSYKLDLRFTTPHPLWLGAESRVQPARGEDLSALGGMVEKNNEVGSHVRCVLYKPHNPEPAKPAAQTKPKAKAETKREAVRESSNEAKHNAKPEAKSRVKPKMNLVLKPKAKSVTANET